MNKKDSSTSTKRATIVKGLRLKRKTKSVLFVLSLLINIYALHEIVYFSESKTIIVKSNEDTQKETVDKIYNLSNYKSVSKFSATAQDRFNRLVKAYEEAIKAPRETKYDGSIVKKDWGIHCKDRVRRIINLQSRVYDLERVLENIFNDVDSTHLMDAIREKGYEEKLSEMSNYYAGFLDEYSYNLIVQSAD